ncbi:hypothetical protein TrLO_g6556 [Triparma laevis f. longispina]|uniref:Uncharacterized protein n=1 Tax=Triparma laevis f. longispina TaxID=1714387 RepID=A0A9W7FCH9_9STRA|nr:hypothetical protein TrLO_g6556 [Triparma laevis f. longispina]
MSKFVVSESNYGHKSREISRKMGSGDEGDENEEGIPEVLTAEKLMTSTTQSTVHAITDQFMHTSEFRRHFVEFRSG